MRVLVHASIFGQPPHPQHWCHENSLCPHARDPVPLLHYQMDKNPALNTNLEHLVKMLGEQVQAAFPCVSVLGHLIHPLLNET